MLTVAKTARPQKLLADGSAEPQPRGSYLRLLYVEIITNITRPTHQALRHRCLVTVAVAAALPSPLPYRLRCAVALSNDAALPPSFQASRRRRAAAKLLPPLPCCRAAAAAAALPLPLPRCCRRCCAAAATAALPPPLPRAIFATVSLACSPLASKGRMMRRDIISMPLLQSVVTIRQYDDAVFEGLVRWQGYLY